MAKTDINYINGLIISAYKNLITRDRLMRMAEANSAGEVLAALTEQGYSSDVKDPREYGKTLEVEEEKLTSFIRSAGFDAEINAFCLSKNDFHNAECAVRQKYIGQRLNAFRPAGEYPITAFTDALSGKKSTLGKELDRAMTESSALFENGTASGSSVSTIFLKAYYARVLAKVKTKRLKDVVRFEIDAKNCSITLRSRDFSEAEKMLIPGGEFTSEQLKVLALRDLRAAELEFAYTERYDYIRVALDEMLKGKPMRAFEKAADDYAIDRFDEVRYEFEGKIPVLLYYLYKSAEIKNVRTIMSLKLIDCPPDEIKSRLRKGYVG